MARSDRLDARNQAAPNVTQVATADAVVTAIKGSPAPAAPAPAILGGIRYCTSCLAIYRQDFQRCPLDGGTLMVDNFDPWIGASIGIGSPYVIDALVGEGAMGRVYAAHRVDLPERRYAIKILIGDLAATERMRLRFQQEAEHASKLAHPNVINVVDYGQTERGVHYLVMDLVEGPSLGSIVQRGPMDADRVIRLARQLCEGLDHAHSRGMIHRDFKPDNILVLGEGELETVRIADFGLALSVETTTRLTTTGIVCTPAYAAPEQLRGQPIDHRVDLYALGTSLYEMLSGGHLPFAGELDASVRSKLMNEAPSVLLVAPNVPPALVSIVGRLLSSDPTRRPRSARAVARALERAVAAPRAPMVTEQTMRLRRPSSEPRSHVIAPVPSRPGAPPPASVTRSASRSGVRPRSRLRRTLVQLFACGLALGGAYAYVSTHHGSEPIAFAAPPPSVSMTVEAKPVPAAEPVAPPVEAPRPSSAEPSIAVRSRPPVRVVGKREHARPTVDPAQADADGLARRYGSVGRALKRLDETLGRENTDDLWAAFHSIPIVDALKSKDGRDDAAATLAQIEEAIVDRSPLP